MSGCTLDDVLAVLPPGDSCSYETLIERLKSSRRPTAGVGVIVGKYTKLAHGQRDELIAWMRDRYWDDEVTGGWDSCLLWIARKPSTGGADGEHPGS